VQGSTSNLNFLASGTFEFLGQLISGEISAEFEGFEVFKKIEPGGGHPAGWRSSARKTW
jgi:hypothetical protein